MIKNIIQKIKEHLIAELIMALAIFVFIGFFAFRVLNTPKKVGSAIADAVGITATGQEKAIKIDFSDMILSLYKNGYKINEFEMNVDDNLNAIKRIPDGKYSVISKEEKSFSDQRQVWMPYTVKFYDSFFIYGESYSHKWVKDVPDCAGGCIKLENREAEMVFNFADEAVPVFVVSDGREDIASGYFFNEKRDLDLDAKAYLVADIDTGEILLEKDMNKIVPIASLTKMMAAVISLENTDQLGNTGVSRDAINTYGTMGGLASGESFVVGDLLYPLLLESSNDAAEVLAEHFGREKFLDMMNKKAAELGMEKTYFDDPAGLSVDTVSSAGNLFKLAKYIYNFENYVLTVTALPKYELSSSENTRYHYWRNTNKFVRNGYKNYLGGKSGFLNEAKQTGISIFKLPFSETINKNIAIIVLGSNNRYSDGVSITDYLADNSVYLEKPDDTHKLAKADLDRIGKLGKKLTMFFVGDIELDGDVEDLIITKHKGDFSFLFNEVSFLNENDIVFGNLQGPVSDIGSDRKNIYSSKTLRTHPLALQSLANAGFNVISINNNHIGDWGESALEDTLLRLEQENILPVGGGLNEKKANEVKVFEKNDLKVGFLGFAEGNENLIKAGKEVPGVLQIDENSFGDIASSSQKVNHLIVSLSFDGKIDNQNLEFEEESEVIAEMQKYQDEIIKRSIDSGAKIVIAYNSYREHEIENYKDGVIVYNPGGFLTDNQIPGGEIGVAVRVTVEGPDIVKVEKEVVKINQNFQPSLEKNLAVSN